MNVAILIRSLANGGAEKQALLLAAALSGAGGDQQGHRVILYVVSDQPRHPPHLRFLERHGLEFEFLEGGAWTRLRRLARELRERGVEALFSFLPGDTLIGGVAGRMAGVPRIFGGLRNTGLSRHKELALKLLHNHVLHATISNSRRGAAHFAARGFDASKLIVIPNGIQLRPNPADGAGGEPAGGEGPLAVITVARFVDKKDPRTALEAVARAVRAGSGLRYLMVGYGSLEESIRRWVVELGLEGVVELRIDPPDVEALFESADVYLGSSRHEGLSNSILEAMNHGLPIVATDAGDTDQLVETGRNGFLVPTGDGAGLAEGLTALASDPALRTRMGAESRRRLEAAHSLESFRAAYERLLAGGVGQ